MEKLAREGDLHPASGEPKWPVPPLSLPREEAELIDKAIEEAFEQVEPEDRM